MANGPSIVGRNLESGPSPKYQKELPYQYPIFIAQKCIKNIAQRKLN